MKIVRTKSYTQKVAQQYVTDTSGQQSQMRRYHGLISLKIFVPWNENKQVNYQQASEIMMEATQSIREANVNADASFEGLSEVSR